MPIFFFLLLQLSFAQGEQEQFRKSVDSLIESAPKSYDQIHTALAKHSSDTIKMAYFAKIAQLNNYHSGQIYALNELGRRFRFLSQFNESLEKHKEALAIARNTDNIELEIYTLNMLGILYRRINAITAALDHTYEALERAQTVSHPDMGIKRAINASVSNIGHIYRVLGQYDLAIEQFNKAIKLEEVLNNKLGLAENNQYIGECLEAQGRLEEALESYNCALRYNQELKNERGEILCQNGIAHVYVHLGKAKMAVFMLGDALARAKKLGEHALIASVHLTLGWALTDLKRYDEAEESLLSGLELARKYGLMRTRAEAYSFLSDLAAAEGNYEQALKYHKTSLDVESQIKNDQNVRYVYNSIIEKDNEARVSSINQQLRKNNTRLLVSGIAIALLAGIFYILYRQYQLKNDKKLLTLEQSMLRSQMNPHFLFNSLNSIKLYIINNEQKNAVHYLNKFSKLVRKILESSSIREIPLAEELETVELYMNIENIRFSNEIEFKVHVDKNIDPHTVRIPSLILQPFLENALWHGLSSKIGDKKIEVHITKKVKDFIDISITDNGIGRKAAEKIKQNKVLKRKSVGIEITKERLANFSKDYLNSFDVEIVDLYDAANRPAGTQVILHIPTA
ncbi:tetratricopeptide repeat protein [Pseudozobellia thermophila]|uniref:tetratricopeptide repeat protein n=1 Tax=Pseudozobellia thermophila TaxID=192903 RepID=UPI001FCDEEDF|nr:tetratricopeptide repeat protein [Pseudozobellia thermophila]